jgi:hypothetical protein
MISLLGFDGLRQANILHGPCWTRRIPPYARLEISRRGTKHARQILRADCVPLALHSVAPKPTVPYIRGAVWSQKGAAYIPRVYTRHPFGLAPHRVSSLDLYHPSVPSLSPCFAAFGLIPTNLGRFNYIVLHRRSAYWESTI